MFFLRTRELLFHAFFTNLSVYVSIYINSVMLFKKISQLFLERIYTIQKGLVTHCVYKEELIADFDLLI